MHLPIQVYSAILKYGEEVLIVCWIDIEAISAACYFLE
jgi:hypothetical protein